MSYTSPYSTFVFERVGFDEETATATFTYSFDETRYFTETVTFKKPSSDFDRDAFDRTLSLSFYLVGTSYYKCFPTRRVVFKERQPDQWQAEFLKTVYTYGLSQFMFENKLTLDDMPTFESAGDSVASLDYKGEGILALQSGGKDSLLLASILEKQHTQYLPWYVSASGSHPALLDELTEETEVVLRKIDGAALGSSKIEGGLNGHVPVTYILESYALADAVLQSKDTVVLSIGAEGNEPHAFIGDLPVNHQWSKTWEAEKLFSEYVTRYISPDLKIGSPLRALSELRIAELFVKECWQQFGHSFSSCNRANYEQGANNEHLQWCGECPKCANTYLLFAPFVEPTELKNVFSGQDLFLKPQLQETFKGLLGIDGVMKPFECVGEVEELRQAYHMARKKYGDGYQLPFSVPPSTFDHKKPGDIQEWAKALLTTVY